MTRTMKLTCLVPRCSCERERQAAEVANTGLCLLSAFATARTMKLTSLVLRLAITERQSARTRESSCVINRTYDKQAIATVSL